MNSLKELFKSLNMIGMIWFLRNFIKPPGAVYNFDVILSNRSPVGIVLSGMKFRYECCCVDFFVKCWLMGERPTDWGGIPDPVEEGYIRCPECAAEIKKRMEKTTN